MPRLRRFGSNIRFFCIRNIFAYSNEYWKEYRSFSRRFTY
jgi:hypothetical protein